MRGKNLLILMLCLVFLAACGGGGGGGVPDPTGGSGSPVARVPEEPTDNDRMRDAGTGDLIITPGTTSNNPPPPQPDPADFETQEYGTQYGLGIINAAEGYANHPRGGYDVSTVMVNVAVFDSGIDVTHPEFSDTGKFVPNAGYDYIREDEDPDSEGNSHGVQVAGIIAADKDSAGIHGVAYKARIIPLRILGRDGSSSNIFDAFRRAIQRARENGASVYNNSWGFVSRHEFTRQGEDVYLPYPAPNRVGFGGELRQQVSLARDSDGIFVWAAGNERWNSENDFFPIISRSDNRCITDSFGRCLGYTREQIRNPNIIPAGVLPTADNQVNGFGGLPNRFPELLGHWLVVVSYLPALTPFFELDLTQPGRIYPGSNGCGDAMNWCLAAPGFSILAPIHTRDPRPDGLNDDLEPSTGTSFAAPHVSGAIAVLKSAFPMMTAPQIVTLLLTTATDLGAVGVDPVYGHGLLNLDEATRPQGAARLASSMTRRGKKGGVMLVSDSRIESSSAFGGAFDETAAQLGAIDSFDRVFPLPLSRLADEDSDAVFPIAHSAVAAVQTFEDEKGFWSRQTADGESLAFGWRGKQGRHRFSVQAEAADDKKHLRELSEEFDAFASSNVLSSGNLASAEWRMDINDAFQTAMRFEMGDGDDSKTHRAAFRASWQASSSLQMAAEIGNYLEKGSLLGAKFRGGLKIGGGSTAYGKLSAHYQLGKWNAVASATKGITRADDLGGIVQSVTSLHSAGFHFGIERESHRGAMRFQVSRDLSVRRGALDLSYVGGYEGNDYRIDSARINLAGSPPTRFAFLFQKHLGICKLKRGAKLSVGVGAEFIANSPRRNYQDNDTILSAAFRCGF